MKTPEGKVHPFYKAWGRMKERCNNPNFNKYSNYGGRGIKYSEQWEKYKNFEKDMLSSWKQGLSLDRIDVNGNYCKENCRWITMKEQQNNRRDNRVVEYAGQEKTLAEWAEILELPYGTIHRRLTHGMSVEMAFDTPLGLVPRKRNAKNL
mgnify:CR=1 FL=1